MKISLLVCMWGWKRAQKYQALKYSIMGWSENMDKALDHSQSQINGEKTFHKYLITNWFSICAQFDKKKTTKKIFFFARKWKLWMTLEKKKERGGLKFAGWRDHEYFISPATVHKQHHLSSHFRSCAVSSNRKKIAFLWNFWEFVINFT